jgi:transcriptional regulator with XRE-family HTH domain
MKQTAKLKVIDPNDECPYCRGTGKVNASPSTRIKSIRESENITQQVFADKVGIGRAQIANLESGRTTPSLELLVRIADSYGVTVDWLLGRP